jgi:ABC-type Fe3+-hydroxamate transport system substrate-binding protein
LHPADQPLRLRATTGGDAGRHREAASDRRADARSNQYACGFADGRAASFPDRRSRRDECADRRPITVADAAGRKVGLAKSPQRIVVVGQGAFMVLHTLFMFPEAKKLVVAH